MELNVVFFPVFALWGLALLLLLFRRGLEALWKLCALLIFTFYVIWFRADIAASLGQLAAFSKTFPLFLARLGDLIALCLILFWPVALFGAFFSPVPEAARSVVKRLVLVTVFFWLFWLLDIFTPPFLSGVLDILGDKLKAFGTTLSHPPVE